MEGTRIGNRGGVGKGKGLGVGKGYCAPIPFPSPRLVSPHSSGLVFHSRQFTSFLCDWSKHSRIMRPVVGKWLYTQLFTIHQLFKLDIQRPVGWRPQTFEVVTPNWPWTLAISLGRQTPQRTNSSLLSNRQKANTSAHNFFTPLLGLLLGDFEFHGRKQLPKGWGLGIVRIPCSRVGLHINCIATYQAFLSCCCLSHS